MIHGPQAMFPRAGAKAGLPFSGFDAFKSCMSPIAYSSVAGKGKIAGRIAAGEPCFLGQLRKYDVERGSGAIACKEVYQMCGQEVYAHRTASCCHVA